MQKVNNYYSHEVLFWNCQTSSRDAIKWCFEDLYEFSRIREGILHSVTRQINRIQVDIEDADQ